MKKLAMTLFVMLFLPQIGHADDKLELICRVNVPDKFVQDPPGWIPPNGEPESIRYKKSYEAFWWNCVMVKAEDIEGRCPFT